MNERASLCNTDFTIKVCFQWQKQRKIKSFCFFLLVPIITKRKKPIVDRQNLICELQFHKEHLFLCSEPFLWYLREEKLEIQIWTSENDTFDYSETSTTDKLIGSVYVDLQSLCDRKRKSHRLNSILPIFKAGSKDLAGASVQIHMTLDKSKDFNELRVKFSFLQTNEYLIVFLFRVDVQRMPIHRTMPNWIRI